MSRALVIGYGNPLRGDDGLGWHAVERLGEMVFQGVEVLACHQLTPELAQPIGEAELVLFIDASVEGEPGTLVCKPVELTTLPPSSLTHEVHPAALLALAQALYGTCPRAFLFSITGDSFNYTDTLSPMVDQMLPILVERLFGLIEEQTHSLARRHNHARVLSC
jgi:hydrogenase maturation protease